MAIWAIMGVQLFGHVIVERDGKSEAVFQSFGPALFTMFQVYMFFY